MAVTPLNPNNTERWFLDYAVLGAQHSLMMRSADHLEAIDAADAFSSFLTSIEGNLIEITIVGLRVALAGSDITNAQSTTGLSATYGTGAGSAINLPLQVTFTGRSDDGHKARVGMFGWSAQTDSSWRITTVEDGDVATGVGTLTSLGASGLFVSISGRKPVWHSYANIGYNDHWVKRARQGI